MGAGMGHKERYGNQVCWEEPPPLCWEREIQSIWGISGTRQTHRMGQAPGSIWE